MDSLAIENLRRVTGTLPSEQPIKSTNVRVFDEALEVSIVDHSLNPYKAMFLAATSTWGNNDFEEKWSRTTLEGKLEVIKAVLTHNTLPQAKEMVNFLFRVNRVPRWLFDYHTQVPFITIMSVGCRDNNKLDADSIITEYEVGQVSIMKDLKDLYEEALNQEQSSWQNARSFLPQCYSHAYHFSQNMLAIVGVKGFHASKQFGITKEENALEILYKHIVFEIRQKFPLLGMYLQIMFAVEGVNVKEIVFGEITKMKATNLSIEDLKYFNQD